MPTCSTSSLPAGTKISARDTALQVLRRVHRGAFSAAALTSALGSSSLSAQDRGFVAALVYGTLRFERALDAQLGPYLKRPDKLPLEIRDVLRLGAFELLYRDTPRHAAVSVWVAIAKTHHARLAGLVNAVLRRLEPRTLTPALAAGLPEWLFEDWQGRFGDERARDIAEGMNEHDPLWLMSYHPQATHALIAEGAKVRLGPLEGTLEVQLSRPLAETQAYRDGWVQPQNPASTLPVRLLEVAPGEGVYDLASGNGIKAAQLAAAGAEVTSVELHGEKLARAAQNLARLGLRARGLEHDLRTVPDLPLAPKVLLDAPCSGTGTLRGNPEIRSRVTPESVAELAALQRDLLRTAAALTAPGGTLVYAVCALTQEEGPDMASWFLQTFPTFEAEPFLFNLPSVNAPEGSTILPLGGLDGFYISRFRRVS